jgi:Flp pilus assembly protein TadG
MAAYSEDRARKDGERGFTLITTGVCSVAMLGMLALAVDLGRMYVVKNEMQSYTDAASLAAVLELDGTQAGITRALNAVAASTNRWNMGASAFSGTETDFGQAASGPWDPNPSPASDYMFARVRASGTLSLYFLPAVAVQNSAGMSAVTVAGQVVKPGFREGLLPFSPFAHNPTPPDFGYTPGVNYTLRWGSNPKVNVNVCPGDNSQAWVDLAEAGTSSERGYIEESSAAIIRAAIEEDYQTRPLSVGDTVTMTGGNKQTERDSLITRIEQDTNPTAATYAAYESAATGNGRRLVAVAINTGYPGNVVLGFGLFFLLEPSEYDHSGNKPFCAEYVGSYVQGSRHKGAGPPGAYVIRLVQ